MCSISFNNKNRKNRFLDAEGVDSLIKVAITLVLSLHSQQFYQRSSFLATITGRRIYHCIELVGGYNYLKTIGTNGVLVGNKGFNNFAQQEQ